jgi:hypothetical protein
MPAGRASLSARRRRPGAGAAPHPSPPPAVLPAAEESQSAVELWAQRRKEHLPVVLPVSPRTKRQRGASPFAGDDGGSAKVSERSGFLAGAAPGREQEGQQAHTQEWVRTWGGGPPEDPDWQEQRDASGTEFSFAHNAGAGAQRRPSSSRPGSGAGALQGRARRSSSRGGSEVRAGPGCMQPRRLLRLRHPARCPACSCTGGQGARLAGANLRCRCRAAAL